MIVEVIPAIKNRIKNRLAVKPPKYKWENTNGRTLKASEGPCEGLTSEANAIENIIKPVIITINISENMIIIDELIIDFFSGNSLRR